MYSWSKPCWLFVKTYCWQYLFRFLYLTIVIVFLKDNVAVSETERRLWSNCMDLIQRFFSSWPTLTFGQYQYSMRVRFINSLWQSSAGCGLSTLSGNYRQPGTTSYPSISLDDVYYRAYLIRWHLGGGLDVAIKCCDFLYSAAGEKEQCTYYAPQRWGFSSCPLPSKVVFI